MFGSHLSVAGGMVNALLEAERLGLDTVQVFTKSQRQWRVPDLKPDARDDWLEGLERLGWQDRTVSHASYLINLASPDDELWHKSIELMVIELERCAALSIPYLVHHPGAYTSSTPEQGLRRIANAYTHIFNATPSVTVVSCLEDTVGSGSNLGRTFDELGVLRRLILDRTGAPERVGFCFDTCHAHAGGYDMSTLESGQRTLDDFDHHCGLEHLRVVHLNDSIGELGSRKDRHAHIGEGTVGGSTRNERLRDTGFAAVVNRPELVGVPMILETPKGETDAGTAFDTLNLRRLKKLREDANSKPEPATGRKTRA